MFFVLSRAKGHLGKNSESPWGDTHNAIDVADPSSMQDARHMNFIIDLAHRGISMAQW